MERLFFKQTSKSAYLILVLFVGGRRSLKTHFNWLNWFSSRYLFAWNLCDLLIMESFGMHGWVQMFTPNYTYLWLCLPSTIYKLFIRVLIKRSTYLWNHTITFINCSIVFFWWLLTTSKCHWDDFAVCSSTTLWVPKQCYSNLAWEELIATRFY